MFGSIEQAYYHRSNVQMRFCSGLKKLRKIYLHLSSMRSRHYTRVFVCETVAPVVVLENGAPCIANSPAFVPVETPSYLVLLLSTEHTLRLEQQGFQFTCICR